MEWMKEKGWINPDEFDFEKVMQIITYSTRPITLGSFNLGLFEIMIRNKTEGSGFFLLSSMLYFLIAFWVASTIFIAKTKTSESQEDLNLREKRNAFKIAFTFLFAVALQTFGLLEIIVYYLQLIPVRAL